jgi:hypothetical protein
MKSLSSQMLISNLFSLFSLPKQMARMRRSLSCLQVIFYFIDYILKF